MQTIFFHRHPGRVVSVVPILGEGTESNLTIAVRNGCKFACSADYGHLHGVNKICRHKEGIPQKLLQYIVTVAVHLHKRRLYTAAHKHHLFSRAVRWCCKTYFTDGIRHLPGRMNGESTPGLPHAVKWVPTSHVNYPAVRGSPRELVEVVLAGPKRTNRVLRNEIIRGEDQTMEHAVL